MELGGIRENILEVRVVRVSALFPERIRSEQTLLVDLMQRKGFDQRRIQLVADVARILHDTVARELRESVSEVVVRVGVESGFCDGALQTIPVNGRIESGHSIRPTALHHDHGSLCIAAALGTAVTVIDGAHSMDLYLRRNTFVVW